MTGYQPPVRPHPATGAWMPGDPPGSRRFLTIPADRPIALEGGVMLRGVTVAYETWGTLNAAADNAVLLCHAWTGDSHAAGPAENGHPTPGWWEGVVGPGLAIDTNEFFVVCANVLGGCQGSTGPASPHPVDGRPYGSRFPVVTIRDMVRAQASLADALGMRPEVERCVECDRPLDEDGSFRWSPALGGVLCERHPALRIVIDHGAKPDIAANQWEPWASAMKALAARPNIDAFSASTPSTFLIR